MGSLCSWSKHVIKPEPLVLCLALSSVWLPYVVSMEATSLCIYIRPIVTAAERKCASSRLFQKGPSDVSPPQAMLWALPRTVAWL